MDIFALDARLSTLFEQQNTTSYSKQKCVLWSELCGFLRNIHDDGTLCCITPKDLCRFFVYKDRFGKTPIHRLSCRSIGVKRPVCDCPRKLAVGTVMGYVKKLKCVFEEKGMGKEWNEALQKGNSAFSNMVKMYVKSIETEQSKCHSIPVQSRPLFVEKLGLIAMYIARHMDRDDLSPRSRFILARDQAFFKLLFFAGDRAHDLGLMLSQEVKCIPNGKGFLIKHTWGKTCSVRKTNTFTIYKCQNLNICPVHGLHIYFSNAKELGVDLTVGYLFRSAYGISLVRDEGLSYGAVYDRLKHYLGILNIDEGETPHSFRAGCTITLAAMGVSKQAIMSHVGWQSGSSYDRYSRSRALIDKGEVAETLLEAAGNINAGHVTETFKSIDMHSMNNALE